jgi:hypothetical protein
VRGQYDGSLKAFTFFINLNFLGNRPFHNSSINIVDIQYFCRASIPFALQ